MKHQQMRFSFLALAVVGLFAVTADATAPVGRFVVGTDPTGNAPPIDIVFDTKTGLTWQRSPGPLSTQDGAAGYCQSIGEGSGALGWRLPTLKEILSLVEYAGDYDESAPLIDQTVFPNTPASTFWSSTKSPARPAQCADFSQGGLFCSGAMNYVRCVR
jgi:hypothetical protein